MYSSKNESVELTSSLIQRPSVSSAPETPSNFLVEKLRLWSREKDRKIYLLVFGAIVAMFVWITLLSLQISSLRRTNLHSDEIVGLKEMIQSLKGNGHFLLNESVRPVQVGLVSSGDLDDAKRTIVSLQTGQADFSKSLQRLEDDDTLLKMSTGRSISS